VIEPLYVTPTPAELVARLRKWGALGGCEGIEMVEENMRPKYFKIDVFRAANELERMQRDIKAMHTGLTGGSCTCEYCV
jgi:hypothetical protein